MRTLTLLVGALACGIGLSGCYGTVPRSEGYPPVGVLREGDGTLSFVICQDVRVSQIDVLASFPESSTEVLWRVAGDTTIVSGEVVNTGSAPAGMTQVVEMGGDPEGRNLVVVIDTVDDRFEDEIKGIFLYDDLSLQRWTWWGGAGDGSKGCNPDDV